MYYDYNNILLYYRWLINGIVLTDLMVGVINCHVRSFAILHAQTGPELVSVRQNSRLSTVRVLKSMESQMSVVGSYI